MRQNSLLLLAIASGMSLVTFWVARPVFGAAQTWWALRNTVTVSATIDSIEYESRKSGDGSRTVMILRYTYEKDGEVIHQTTDRIAPLSYDSEYYSAAERAFETKTPVTLFLSLTDPDVSAFSKDVHVAGMALASILVAGFLLVSIVLWKSVLRSWTNQTNDKSPVRHVNSK